MDKHPIVFLLLILSFPVWAASWLWLFRVMLKRRPSPWVALSVALLCLALGVASYLVVAQWLGEPQYAQISALIYGSPALFFILLVPMRWLSKGSG